MAGSLDAGAVTALLRKWGGGDEQALERILPLVYEELRMIARAYMSQERSAHTLGVTGLVHEAFLRLAGPQTEPWRDRRHFYGIAARLMRQVLVDYARQHGAQKRDSSKAPVNAEHATPASSLESNYVLLDQCLDRLEQVDRRRAEIVELRFFGGLTIREIAEAKDLSASMIKKELTLAKVWLYRQIEMSGNHAPSAHS